MLCVCGVKYQGCGFSFLSLYVGAGRGEACDIAIAEQEQKLVRG